MRRAHSGEYAVSFFFFSCDNITDQSNLKRGEVYFGLQVESTVCRVGENIVLVQEAAGHIALQSVHTER